MAYRLRRHLVAGWSLSRWLGFVLLVAGFVALLCWWPVFWPTASIGGILLVSTIVLGWAARRRYLHFEHLHEDSYPFRDIPSVSPLHAEERVPVRASGWFTVEGRRQHYVDIKANFETVETREHIVLGRVYPSRFLAIGHWPEEDIGWWYVFFKSDMIREVRLGYFCFGSQPRMGLQVVYAPDRETREVVHLVFDDPADLWRVWSDLLRDAPPGSGALPDLV